MQTKRPRFTKSIGHTRQRYRTPLSLPLIRSNLNYDNTSKGGVINLSSGTDWQDDPGAIVIMRTSTFDSNYAEGGNAGVVSLADYTTLFVAGEGNVFRGNECGEDGGAFRGTSNTTITVEGGLFEDNFADGVGGWVGRCVDGRVKGIYVATPDAFWQLHHIMYRV